MKGSSSISTAKKRLFNDLKQFNENDENETILATPHEDNLMIWDCIIFGPEDTPWEGGCFKLTLTFSEEYPNKPPVAHMNTSVFHPNFYTDGRICLDILQNQWSPIIDVHAVLTSIQSLLTDPNPLSPANAEIIRYILYKNRTIQYKTIEILIIIVLCYSSQAFISSNRELNDNTNSFNV